ncbi:unnamed protein product [Allacma fusca]|uniref:Ubiquitin carboxyl-terminal hydrolase n=1 Tax=Allacma fusca TaxID=39272 RepID=A0A8J2LM06_9HEXA|nr:unnamed protein product [Allacma fusca]
MSTTTTAISTNPVDSDGHKGSATNESTVNSSANFSTLTGVSANGADNVAQKPKSATLTPGQHTLPSNGSAFAYNARSNLRRSFTLPRGLFPRKSGQTGPASENKNSNFFRHVFLTLTRSGSTRRRKNPNSATVPNGIDSNGTVTNFGLPSGFTPGALGLKNQGNTCFMNAIVQCLSHTDALAKYLVTDGYKSDLKRRNWIKSGKGEVTEELATILRITWLRHNSAVMEEAVSRFKAAVERGAQQWRGSEQHDAQEFLLWLLDRLHEDLNQAASNKYKPVKSNFGRPEEQVAAEALANHIRCNNSIIQDIFGAQFRSSLTCPGCGRQSATFDPFLCVSLPIPQAKQECPIYVNIVYLSQQPRQVKLGLSSSMSADVKELKQLLAGDTGIAEADILLSEIDGEGFHRTFTETQPVSVLSSNEAVYCLETPQVTENTENDGAYILIAWSNIVVTDGGTTHVRFGSPYIAQIARETGYTDLQKLLLKEMATILQPGILVSEQKDPVFNIRILDGSVEGSLVDPLVEHPLYMESVDHALSLCDEDVPPHIKLHLEWTPAVKDRIIADDSESVEEHSSVAQTRLKHSEEAVSTVTLGECFDLYTSAEQLSAEDSWHCPHCNRKEQGTLKMIGLWTAPQVLVVHLKRFRQALKGRHSATKISSVVEFPVEGLDLTPHISRRSKIGPDSNICGNIGSLNQVSSPINGCFSLGHWKRASFKKHLPSANLHNRVSSSQGSQVNHPEDRDHFLYDLYAVCNHHGKDVQGGHYTAYCKNPVEGSWWSFDDTRVTKLSSSEEVTSASAYILFYHKRSSNLPLPPNSYHWCRSLLKKYHKALPVTASTNNSINSVIRDANVNAATDLSNSVRGLINSSDQPVSNGFGSNNDSEHILMGSGGLSATSNSSSNVTCKSASQTLPSQQQQNLKNGYLETNGVSCQSSVISSSRQSSNKLNSDMGNSAPLARMEEIALGIGLGLPKEVQIESTV